MNKEKIVSVLNDNQKEFVCMGEIDIELMENVLRLFTGEFRSAVWLTAVSTSLDGTTVYCCEFSNAQETIGFIVSYNAVDGNTVVS